MVASTHKILITGITGILGEALFETLRKKYSVVGISRKNCLPAKRPLYSVLDNAKFFDVFGFKLRNWVDALTEYLRGENEG